MKERPILFSAPMVRAILDGRKTQTRRVVKPQPDVQHWQNIQAMHGRSPDGKAFGDPYKWRVVGPHYPDDASDDVRSPYAVGDRLWVRETFAAWDGRDLFSGRLVPMTAYRAGRRVHASPETPGVHVPLEQWPIEWRDDFKPESMKWTPSIHMPRAASRITIEVTDVRVERLQALSRADAAAEGICYPEGEPKPEWYRNDRWPEENFAGLWDAINGAGAWHANPWVWVVCFQRVRA